MNLNQIPVISNQEYYDKNKDSLDGWYRVDQSETTITIDGRFCFAYIGSIYVFLSKGKIKNDKDFCLVKLYNMGLCRGESRVSTRTQDGFTDFDLNNSPIWAGSTFLSNPEAKILYIAHHNESWHFHNLSGPAVIEGSKKEYYINGDKLTYKEFLQHKEVAKHQVLQLIKNS